MFLLICFEFDFYSKKSNALEIHGQIHSASFGERKFKHWQTRNAYVTASRRNAYVTASRQGADHGTQFDWVGRGRGEREALILLAYLLSGLGNTGPERAGGEPSTLLPPEGLVEQSRL